MTEVIQLPETWIAKSAVLVIWSKRGWICLLRSDELGSCTCMVVEDMLMIRSLLER